MDWQKMSLESHDGTADKRAALWQLFPEARTEAGQVDWAQLQRALGEMIDTGKGTVRPDMAGQGGLLPRHPSPHAGDLAPCATGKRGVGCGTELADRGGQLGGAETAPEGVYGAGEDDLH